MNDYKTNIRIPINNPIVLNKGMSVIKQMKAKDELVFIAKISKMGDKNRIIWIPAVLHEMLREFEDKKIKVRISRAE